MSHGGYRCESCGAQHYGAPVGVVICGYCGQRMERREPTEAAPQAAAAPKASMMKIAAVVVGILMAIGIIAGVAVRATAGTDASSAPAPAVARDSVAPEPPRSVTVEPKRQSRPTARFDFHGVRKSSGSAFYVLGRVVNTSAETVSKPKIVVALKDASGAEVGSAVGFATREVLAPGESSPVSAIIEDATAYDSLDFEVHASPATYRPRLAAGLEVQPEKPTQNRFGSWVASGKVTNTGKTAARFVEIEMLGLDQDDKILGVYSAYADTQILAPGETSRYRILGVRFDDEPARFEFSATGKAE